MPYIASQDRFKFDNYLEVGKLCDNAGELNYLLSSIINNYLKHKGLKYQNMNDIIGALEGCKQEFYRRVVSPYEDKKATENGDLYKKFSDVSIDKSIVGKSLQDYLLNLPEYNEIGYTVVNTDEGFSIYIWNRNRVVTEIREWQGYPVKYKYTDPPRTL